MRWVLLAALLVAALLGAPAVSAADCTSTRVGSFTYTDCSGPGGYVSGTTYDYGTGFADTSISGSVGGQSVSGSGSSYTYGGTGFTDSSYSGSIGGQPFSGSSSSYTYPGTGITDTDYTINSGGRRSSGSFSCYDYGLGRGC